jgi:hypothetical protein
MCDLFHLSPHRGFEFHWLSASSLHGQILKSQLNGFYGLEFTVLDFKVLDFTVLNFTVLSFTVLGFTLQVFIVLDFKIRGSNISRRLHFFLLRSGLDLGSV